MSQDLQQYQGNVTTYTHSIKLEATAKGIFRPSFHVFGNGYDSTITETIRMVQAFYGECERKGIPLQPMSQEMNNGDGGDTK